LTDLDPRQKAERIVELFRSRRPTEILPAEVYPASLDEAYAIRCAFQEIEETRGRGEIAGYKIGLTTPVMQRLCGIAEPCYGAIFAREVHDHPAELRADDYCRIGVETEIVLRLGDDLPQGGDAEHVALAVESAAAAIELIEDLRYDYRRLDAAAMVAGNVWSAGAVLGALVTGWRAFDLAQAAARLSINGREIGSGVGSDVMGHPLNALAWLAGKLADAGTPLRRGMIVMTGSMVPIQHPLAGDRVLVEVSGLGAAELVLS
jgi:2-oxo-3-hexenedioate decarboxylase/2-keto-4-pentenoate hydratase